MTPVKIAVIATRQIAIPGANRGTLGNRPLLHGLATGADNPPDFLAPPRRQHGFKMRVSAATCQTWADSIWIKFFHAVTLALFHKLDKSAIAPPAQSLAPLLRQSPQIRHIVTLIHNLTAQNLLQHILKRHHSSQAPIFIKNHKKMYPGL